MFDRGRLEIEKLNRRLHCFRYRCEKDQTQTFLAGQGRNLELSGENGRQRSFAAGENIGQIIWRAQESFDAVAGPAFDQTRRPALGHFGGMFSNYFENLCRSGSSDAI